MREISWLAEKRLASQEGIYSMELVIEIFFHKLLICNYFVSMLLNFIGKCLRNSRALANGMVTVTTVVLSGTGEVPKTLHQQCKDHIIERKSSLRVFKEHHCSKPAHFTHTSQSVITIFFKTGIKFGTVWRQKLTTLPHVGEKKTIMCDIIARLLACNLITFYT
jgi:hypothetical protein